MVKPDEILTELQSFLTLEDGDIVMTGTPKGVGVIQSSDQFFGAVFLTSQGDLETKNRLINREWQAQ